MKRNRAIALTAVPLAVALALTGCAVTGGGPMPGMNPGGGTSSADATGEFNAADSMFTVMMIPHHEQAVEMSDLLLGKTGVDQEVLQLAQQIKDAQAPEIELMQSWLDAWGIPSAGEMNHGDGMMSAGDMAALEAAEGAEAARLFLEQMIVHHQGAIEMAETELTNGINPDVLELAEAIIDAQTAEIATMQELLEQP